MAIKEIEISEENISKLMRGERPEGMDYVEFKLKQKALRMYLKQYKKGKLIKQESNDRIK